ncbi:NAD(P)-binding domain-containing protein [Spirillospora sp. NPDC048911]|uniref:NAD(P)-binding domain-containing protein n=1 Tax=Spirillospora sp. NPDC048911 TaxID=3364527 RepID=UPI00371CFC87
MHDSLIDTLIVGAGPYGLSIAAHAQAHGLDVRVIGTPMDFWQRHMPAGMLLKSEPFASNLSCPAPGSAFNDLHPGWSMGQPIPLTTFVSYGRWFAENTVRGIEEVQVDHVRATAPGFTVTLSTGEEVRTRTVVMAIGVRQFAHVPDQLSSLPAELATHSVEHHDLSRFAGRDVTVIGAGQSALETAVLLADAGARPTLISRNDQLAWNALPQLDPSLTSRIFGGPQSGLGRGWRTWLWSEHPASTRVLSEETRHRIVRTTLGPAGAWWLRERLDHRVTVRLGERVVEADVRNGRAQLSAVTSRGAIQLSQADHVIAATGYVPDIDKITILDPDLRRRLRLQHRSPDLSRHFESSVPGLYFAGLTAAASFGPVMRFVHGSSFAARRIANNLAKHRVRTPPNTAAMPAQPDETAATT